MSTEPQPQSLNLPARTIPAPSSVSAAAREMLAGMAFLTSAQAATTPALDDAEGWRKLVADTDEMLLPFLEASSAGSKSTVETVDVDGARVFVVTPENVAPEAGSRVFLDIHGGGLLMGGGECCRASTVRMADLVGVVTWGVDYRMPPDHPYPAALDDCLTVYRALLRSHRPEEIIVGGASAGGNLAAALLLRARDEGLPPPAAVVLLTPQVDLTESGDSFATNMGLDVVLTSSLLPQSRLYAAGHDLADPYLSPLFGDFTPEFPPTFLQAGTRDLFLSNAVRLHRKLRAAGVQAELHVFEAMPHGGFFGAPEDDELSAEIRRFVDARW
ncbi:alpha/beta hydrolase [Frankia sp. AgB1.9]|uniref:alpha/beta hydrolase n=1 Tax=unclassified Frankia TaxID=2632575 RepID=UPI0019340268|nr:MULTISPECIES: alpha/beta hydrolase [unclassified Frankia]MBL7493562.1 alpha/beta hydrolase [Frankia sp. AgW1.1]MBL7549823.1 alpha/beta hydrolase [Frankia sp. AgB1.9]MBL7622421.1 alpha/beta hydrolase [Frankia sp. AgB1.8]